MLYSSETLSQPVLGGNSKIENEPDKVGIMSKQYSRHIVDRVGVLLLMHWGRSYKE